MGKKRVNRNNSAVSSNEVDSTQNNAYSGGKKSLSVGPDFKKQSTNTFISGLDASAGISINPWSQLWLYNNAGAVAWVAMGTATLAAPTGFSNAMPLPPNAWTKLAAGENSLIRTSAATVGLYCINDDTSVVDVT